MKMIRRILSTLFLFIFLSASLGGSPAVPPGQAQRIHPVLAQLAAQDPDQSVSILVQKTDDSQEAEAEVARLGGRVTFDLSIIHAFAASMPAGLVRQLAAAPGVQWVTLDAPMKSSACTGECVSPANLKTAYIRSIRADKVWSLSTPRQGKGIGVAVLDSGVNWQTDLYTNGGQNRVVANVRFNTDYNQTYFDNFGHGSNVAGVVGGNGRSLNGYYVGVAPQSNLINVKVSNDDGSASASTVIAGLQWVLQNKAAYNIRVVNLSLNSAVAESYNTSPLDAAVEVLWFNGIVVVVSAGNNGTATLYPPANDPFVITVGAVDDKGTPAISDDTIPSFSAYGATSDGFSKPDLVAPGKSIISLMGNASGAIPVAHPGNKVNNAYFMMSGTSVSAPVVSGAVALLLEDEPNLNPDQVKSRLMATANKSWSGYNATKAGAGYLDAYAAVTGTSTTSANTNVPASKLLWTGSQPVTWGSVSWNSVSWNSVSWNSVSWNSVSWNSVSWNSDYWGQ